MDDEWTRMISGDRFVKFTYSDLPGGEAFLTAQIATGSRNPQGRARQAEVCLSIRATEPVREAGFVQLLISVECPSEANVRGNRVAASWLIIGVVLTGGIQAHQSVSERRLDPAIGPPNIAIYESILHAQDWLNPYLSVCGQGVVLSARSVNRVNETVSVDTLRKVLLDLPVTAWPYGRVVVLQDCSLGSPGDIEDRKTRMLQVEEILNTLGLETSHWPG